MVRSELRNHLFSRILDTLIFDSGDFDFEFETYVISQGIFMILSYNYFRFILKIT